MSALRRPDAYSCRYRRSLCRWQDSRLSRPALTATPGCSRSPEPTPRNRRIVMAKRATFAEVCLRPVQCFILLRQSCVFKFVCARKTPAQHRPMQSCAWNRVFHHSRPHNSRIGSGWKTAFISPMLRVHFSYAKDRSHLTASVESDVITKILLLFMEAPVRIEVPASSQRTET